MAPTLLQVGNQLSLNATDLIENKLFLMEDYDCFMLKQLQVFSYELNKMEKKTHFIKKID